MPRPLTALSVNNAKPDPKRRVEITDGVTPGLRLVVQPSGSKSWAFRYEVAGRPTKVTFGPASGPGALSLAEAREQAGQARRGLNAGADPAAERKAVKVAAIARVEAEAPNDLVEDVVEQFIEKYAKVETRESSWRETKRILDREVVPLWKGRRLSSLDDRDVLGLLDIIVDRGSPIMANRVFAAVRKMCGWAVKRRIVDANPCDRVEPPSSEKSRDRVLKDDELARVLHAADELGWPFGVMFKMLALTAARRDEVAEMRWGEVDLDKALWTIPRERVKTDSAHEVPLSAPVLSLLRAAPNSPKADQKAARAKDFVFTTNDRTSISGFSRAKARLDVIVAADGAPLTPWRTHDLRRTAATGMARLGVALPTTEKVLNHTSGTFGGIVGVYQRHGYENEKRDALDRWAGYVVDLAPILAPTTV